MVDHCVVPSNPHSGHKVDSSDHNVNKTEDESKAHQNHAQGNGVTDIEEVVKLDADHAEF